MRGIATMLLHITATGIIGYALGRKKFSPEHKKSIVVKAVIMAAILHSAFNFLTLMDYGIYIAFLMVLGAFLFLLKLIHNPETRLVWRLVTPEK